VKIEINKTEGITAVTRDARI